LDVEAIVAELQGEVARKRATGAYPASVIALLETPFHPDEDAGPPEVFVQVESARPLRSTRPVVGGATVLCKRVVRRLLSWYIAPIARDQTRFNLAILRELRALEERVARLESPSASAVPDPDTEALHKEGS
jgi:hypothetical protein